MTQREKPVPTMATDTSYAAVLARGIIKDAERAVAIERVFAEVQAICNRHRNNECAKEISALLTRKVW